ncbi:tripartite tricarboxylate transporter TctB family protein [Actinorugispora endophytica]|uniref:Tripartite tricarboxylate transporter TctB family protein n=1 Tax=Actinorugispora endophytica TaxID=1605990 RepID=A0A4R6UZY5_9ACTN|nr:tripartite tricarboxylate transporter TctB family protein [Actinorugispora endophytica]TDQ53044.1 tripartite tricarboxylate transporter TctB family protein [Actinorugispora endophytica]
MSRSWLKRPADPEDASLPADADAAPSGPGHTTGPGGAAASPEAPAPSPGDALQDGEDDEDGPAPLGPAANLVVAIVVVALGGAGMAGSWSLGLGGLAEPSAGTWPFLISAAVSCLGVVLGATARSTRDTEVFSSSVWKVLAGIATMVLFVSLVGVIGFEIPSAVLAFVWLRFLGGESWRLSAVTSVAVVAAFYVVFVGLLAVPIPHLF